MSEINDLQVTPEVVEAISGNVPGLDSDQIGQVLTALNNLKAGAAVGTLLRADNGYVAHRVQDAGRVVWRISGPDGVFYTDPQQTLPWTQIYPPVEG